VREASLKAGARDRHDPEVKAAAAAGRAAAKKEKQAKKAAAEAAKETNLAAQRAKRAATMKKRRGRAVAKRLKAGTCSVRLRMRAVPPGEPDPWRKPLAMLRWFWLRNANQRSEMRSTCWVWCAQTEKWCNPHEFFSPSAQLRGERHVPRCVFVGSVPPPRWPAAVPERAREERALAVEEKVAWANQEWEAAGLKVPPPVEEEAAEVDEVDLADAVHDLVEWMVQTLEAPERRRLGLPPPDAPPLPPRPPPPTPVALPPMDAETRKGAKAVRRAARERRAAEQERARAAKVEEARRWDELVQAAMTGEVSSDDDEEAVEEEEKPPRVAVRLHASSVMPGRAVLSCRASVAGAPRLPACAKPPAAPWLADAAAACEKAVEEWKRETPLASAQRQKVHWWKDEAGMSDGVLYKHLRDHNLEHAEVCAEVARRRELIREGKGGEYAPPEMGRPVLGLLDGQPVPYPKAGPVVNPWVAYLAERSANQVAALAGAHWTIQ